MNMDIPHPCTYKQKGLNALSQYMEKNHGQLGGVQILRCPTDFK